MVFRVPANALRVDAIGFAVRHFRTGRRRKPGVSVVALGAATLLSRGLLLLSTPQQLHCSAVTLAAAQELRGPSSSSSFVVPGVAHLATAAARQPQGQQEHVEIEVRFEWSESIKEKLVKLSTGKVVETSIEDSYLDNASRELTLANFWLRLRQGHWELKYPQDKADQRSYTELADEEHIRTVLNEELRLGLPLDMSLAASLHTKGIEVFATLRTERSSMAIPAGPPLQEVRVDLDVETTLDARVGELEICLPAGSSPADVAATRKALESFATSDLGLTLYKKGGNKILQYLQRYDPEHYAKLVKTMQKY